MCNGMNSTTEILRNENTIFDESKSPDLTEEKEKIPSEYKTLKKKKLKRRRIVKTNLEKKEKKISINVINVMKFLKRKPV